MTIQELFEQRWADLHDVPVESMPQYRWKDREGYRLPGMAKGFRMFCAGFEANQGEKMQVLGYLSLNNAQKLLDGKMSSVRKEQADTHPVAIYAKQCEPLKPGDEDE